MLKSFRGGFHPTKDCKGYTAKKPIEKVPLPSKVIIPVRQHIGTPCTVLVEKGELVKKGQKIAESDSFVSAPVHASVSGKVLDIAEYPHGIFGKCLAIAIESDDQDEWVEGLPLENIRDWKKLNNDELRKIIREAGIVGMGGATFPTHVKLAPPKGKKVDTFILNAAECEPYLTSDHSMMLEYPERIVTGVKIVMKILDVTKGYVGIEDNKPDAVAVMQKAFTGTQVEVVSVPTKYPQGAEKMLIRVLTGKEVPSGGLPMDVGIVVQNVGTVISIADAVQQGIPVIERVTTVSGSAVKEPKNLLIRVGTTFGQAIEYCAGIKGEIAKLILGGPMMGFAQTTLDVPIIKGVSGILALTKDDLNMAKESSCIRCGACVKVCPMGLVPSMLSILGQNDLYQEAVSDYDLLDCIECGSCVYVCPAKRNMIQYIRNMKTKNAAQGKQ